MNGFHNPQMLCDEFMRVANNHGLKLKTWARASERRGDKFFFEFSGYSVIFNLPSADAFTLKLQDFSDRFVKPEVVKFMAGEPLQRYLADKRAVRAAFDKKWKRFARPRK